MQDGLLQQGIDLMLLGMGTVFVFLTLLVFCIKIMSKIVLTFFPEAPMPSAPAAQRATSVNIKPLLEQLEAAGAGDAQLSLGV